MPLAVKPRRFPPPPLWLLVAAFAVASLCFDANSAVADEADDAVQILSTMWKGMSERYSTEFTGDSKTLRIRLEGKSDDGTVFVHTDETSFRFLQITDPAARESYVGYLGPDCESRAVSCVAVACIGRRSCISTKTAKYDPVYHDPRREGTESSPNSWSVAMGYVNPMNHDKVLEALRTLIRLNAAPPFVLPR
jgi:hypothetical protein